MTITRKILLSFFALLLSGIFSLITLLPTPAHAVTTSYFVMGQVYISNGTGTATGAPKRIVADENITVTTEGTFTIYMANGTTASVSSLSCNVTGSPKTLSAGSNTITVAGTGTFLIDLTLGTAANWSSNNSWSSSSGGPCGDTYPNSSTADVYFDANSFTRSGQILSYDDYYSFRNMDWTGATNTPALNRTDDALLSYGNMTFISNMLDGASYPIFVVMGTDNRTLDMKGRSTNTGFSLGQDRAIGHLHFRGTLTLLSNAKVGTLTHSEGTFNTNSCNLTVNYSWDDQYGYLGTKNLILGSSVITVSRKLYIPSYTSFDAGTSTFSLPSIGYLYSGTVFYGWNYTWYDVSMNNVYTSIGYNNTFHNLTRSVESTKTDTFTFPTGETVVTGVLSLSGDSKTNRLLVQSSTVGTAATIHTDNWTPNGIDLMDITSTHSLDLSAASNYSGDCGGNSNITFTTAAPQYWHKDTGSWSTVGQWFLGSDGSGGAGRVPLPQDPVIFDASSMDAGSKVVTLDMPRAFYSLTTTVIDNSPSFSSSIAITGYDNITLGSSMTFSSLISLTLGSRLSGRTLTFSGLTCPPLIFNNPGGTYILQDNLTSSGGITLNYGSLDTNDKNVVCGTFSSTSGSTGLDISNSTITLNSTSAVTKWSLVNGPTFTSSGSTIIITNSGTSAQTFAGGGTTARTYDNVTITGSGVYDTTISGSNTFASLNIDRSAAAKTLKITNSTTQTVGTFNCPVSSSTYLTITNRSSTTPGIMTKTGGGTIGLDYLHLSNSTVNPQTVTWYAGTHSDNSTAVTGWIFNIPPPSSPTNVSASDGIYGDRVVISWTKSSTATEYKIYDNTTSALLSTLGDVATDNDTTAAAPTVVSGGSASATDNLSSVTLSLSGQSSSPGTTRQYKVAAGNSTGYGDNSTVDGGYRGDIKTYQWFRSSGDSDSDYSSITPINSIDYGAPADGSGRYYKCLTSLTGATDNQTSSVDRGYRIPLILDNSPSSKNLGSVTENSTYYARGVSPHNPVEEGDCSFTTINKSSVGVDVYVQATNFTGGNGWTLSDNTSGIDTVKMTVYAVADYPNQSTPYTVVLSTSPQIFLLDVLWEGNPWSPCMDDGSRHWDFSLQTGAFSDGVAREGHITLSVVENGVTPLADPCEGGGL